MGVWVEFHAFLCYFIRMAIASRAQIETELHRNDIRFAAIFGSRAKGVARSDSDYDFLIEFAPEKKYSLFDIVDVKENLEKILQNKVDVVTIGGLNPRM